MGKTAYYSEVRHTTAFQYDLSDPDDRLTDRDFERVREAVLDWSSETSTPCEVRKTQSGFEVAITHYVKNGDAFGMSLFLHLSAGIFRQLEAEARSTDQDIS